MNAFRFGGRARVALTVALLLPFAVLAGCQTGTVGRDLGEFERIVRGQDTKDSIYQRFGAPSDVFPAPRGGTLLVYERQVELGMGFGAGYGMFPALMFSHSHVGSDSAYVVVDANGIVTDFGVRKQSELAERRLWPFGK